MRQLRRLHLTYEEQGARWRAAGGDKKGCWYGIGTTERRLWEKGWLKENQRLAEQEKEEATEG